MLGEIKKPQCANSSTFPCRACQLHLNPACGNSGTHMLLQTPLRAPLAALNASEATCAPATKLPERVLVFPHIMKTGGTALSTVLYYASKCVVAGSHESAGFKLGSRSALGLAFRRSDAESEARFRRGQAVVAYAHADVDNWRRLVNVHRQVGQSVRFLVLVRQPVPHRMSWFKEQKGGSASKFPAEFGAWVRSKDYSDEMLSYQLQYLKSLWKGRLNTSEGNGDEEARALLTNPDVAWVGVSDNWAQSMLTLEPVLSAPLLDFALSVDSRTKAKALAVNASDYAYLAALEARESIFVATLSREVDSKAALIASKRLEPTYTSTSLHRSTTGVCPSASIADVCGAALGSLRNAGCDAPSYAAALELLAAQFRSKEIILATPASRLDGRGHSAARQYSRIALRWLSEHGVAARYETYHDGKADELAALVKGDRLESGTLRGASGGRVLVLFTMPQWTFLSAAMFAGTDSILVHDSICAYSAFDACTKQGWRRCGCPKMEAFTTEQRRRREGRGGAEKGVYARIERMAFTPWGSESANLVPNKTTYPSMLLDATKSWHHFDASEFVARVATFAAELKLQISWLGPMPNRSFPTSIAYLGAKLPLSDFQAELSRTWFFASGIQSSYELSLVDAQMAGATIVDVGGVAQLAAIGPSTVSVKQYDVEAMRGQLATEIRRFDFARSHEYAMAFHDDDYVMSNLLCALLS